MEIHLYAFTNLFKQTIEKKIGNIVKQNAFSLIQVNEDVEENKSEVKC